MQSDKEVIISLLKHQLDVENDKSYQEVYDNPDGWVSGQENTAQLVTAIFLLEQHDWTVGGEEEE